MRFTYPSISPALCSRVWALASSLAIAGCGAFAPKKEPPPFVAPTVAVEATHYYGSALGGPTTRAVAAVPPAQALAVRVRFLALENLPVGGGLPLSATARLITADRLGTPVLSSARLAGSARVVPLRDPADVQSAVVDPSGGRSAEVYDGTAAVAAGVTAKFVLPRSAPGGRGPTAAAGESTRVELYVSRPAEPAVIPAAGPVPVELALVVQDVAPLPQDEDRPTDVAKPGKGAAAGRPAGPARPAVPPALTLQRETALLDRAVDPRDVVCFVLPFRLGGGTPDNTGPGGGGTRAVAVVVDVARDSGSPAHLDALSRAVEDGRKQSEAAAESPGVGPRTPGGRAGAGLSAAVDGLAGGGDPRASLVYLAGQAGARLCEDVALVADDATLAELATEVRAAVGTTSAAAGGPATAPTTAVPPDPAAAGWRLDKAAFDLLGRRAGNNALPPELAAVLAAHTGEAGRHPSSFEEIGRAATGRLDFENRLVGENLIYLEDSSPSARVRAYDWLRGRDKAPPGFDPLGPPKDRRAALDRAAGGGATAAP